MDISITYRCDLEPRDRKGNIVSAYEIVRIVGVRGPGKE
jgi:hypothetical protein